MKRLTWWVASVAVLAGCSEPSGPGQMVKLEVPASRAAGPAVPGLDSETRFKGTGGGRSEEQQRQEEQDAESFRLFLELAPQILKYDLPEGWEVQAPTEMRIVNLRPAADPNMECYVTFMPLDGGGAMDNVNRWRGQMGLADIGMAELEEMPVVEVLAHPGGYVDLEGDFKPMGATEASPGYRMLGVHAPMERLAVFVKFTGPAEGVTAEEKRFEEFYSSLHWDQEFMNSMHSAIEDPTDHAPQPAAEPTNSGAGMKWEAPERWVDLGGSRFTIVKYKIGENTECSVSAVGGPALDNYNRWCGQVGAPSMGQGDYDALPTIEIDGVACPVLEVSGNFQGMSGGGISNATILGVRYPIGRQGFYVKMVGPADEVAAAKADFEALCASIEEE